VAFIALIAVTAVWGVTFVQVKDAVDVYPLFAFLAMRYGIAAGVLAVPAAGRARSLGSSGLRAGALLGVLGALGIGLQTAGLHRTTVSSTGFITGLYVVLTPLFGLVLFGTRVGTEVWAGVALSIAGLAMLSGVRVGSTEGDLLVLASTSAQALQIVMVERYARRFDAIALTLVAMTTSCVGFLAVALARGDLPLPRGWTVWGARAARDRNLRQRACRPDPGLGAAADERGADRTRLRARDGVGRNLRLLALGRPPRLAGLGRLRVDPRRDRARRARRGRHAAPDKPAIIGLRFSQPEEEPKHG